MGRTGLDSLSERSFFIWCGGVESFSRVGVPRGPVRTDVQ